MEQQLNFRADVVIHVHFGLFLRHFGADVANEVHFGPLFGVGKIPSFRADVVKIRADLT